MRYALVIVGVMAAVSSEACGQGTPYLANVSTTGAELRAGSSEQYPVTATLKPGDTVWVDHEEDNGWLAVQDPPGKHYSLSWVSVQFVSSFDKNKGTPQNVTVEEATALCPGKLDENKPLTGWRMKSTIPAGTILSVVGPRATVDGKSWYPVLPPAGDFRYILKSQVKPGQTLNTSFTIRDTIVPTSPVANVPPAAILPPPPPVVIGPPAMPTGSSATAVATGSPSTSAANPPAPPPTPPKPVVQHPLWAQAEAAEQEGRLDDAEKLYFQLARLMNEPGGDHDVANLCYTRIHALREKKRASSPVAGGNPRATLAFTSQQVGTSLPPATAAAPPPSGQRIVTGTLVRAKIDYDGHVNRTYMLEIAPGNSIVYVIGAPGVDLERYVNKRVDVNGASSKHKDLSMPLVTATSAEIVGEK